MKLEDKNTVLAILWGPTFKIWEEIVKSINTKESPVLSANIYTPINSENDDAWKKFVIDTYLSHEIIDNPQVDILNKTKKLFLKLEKEHLMTSPRKICILAIKLENKEILVSKIREELKKEWKYTDARLLKTYNSYLGVENAYELNLIKDITRKRFYNNSVLPPYYEGMFSGRKRIMHAPVTVEGCKALEKFLADYPHTTEKLKYET